MSGLRLQNLSVQRCQHQAARRRFDQSFQKFLNLFGDSSVYRTVCWMFLCSMYCCRRQKRRWHVPVISRYLIPSKRRAVGVGQTPVDLCRYQLFRLVPQLFGQIFGPGQCQWIGFPTVGQITTGDILYIRMSCKIATRCCALADIFHGPKSE